MSNIIEPIALGRPRRTTLYWHAGSHGQTPGPGDVLCSTSKVRHVESRQLILQARPMTDRIIGDTTWTRLRCDVVSIVPGTEPRDAWCVPVHRGLPTAATG